MTPTAAARGNHAQPAGRTIVTEARLVGEPRPAGLRMTFGARRRPLSSIASLGRGRRRNGRSCAASVRGRFTERGARTDPGTRAAPAPTRDVAALAAGSRRGPAT